MSADLYTETKDIWTKSNLALLSVRWAQDFARAKAEAINLTRFNNWKPLKIFTSLSNARKSVPVFSVRYQGQEVAELIADDKILLNIKNGHEQNNKKCFGVATQAQTLEWKKASDFRKIFIELDRSPQRPLKMKSDEAWLQSIIFESMAKSGDSGYHACQPVVFADRFPLQCPVPISANSGFPKDKKGNLDILARRGLGGTHPAIWELKRPSVCGTAFEQAYIYGVTLVLMLRAEGGDLWYKNMGFSRTLGKSKLTIDTIVTITKDKESQLMSHIKRFASPLKLGNENAVIRPFVAYYEWDKEKNRVKVDEPVDLSPYLNRQ